MFFEMLDEIGFKNLDTLLEQYSEMRVPDAHAICDLAVNNYTEVNLFTIYGQALIEKRRIPGHLILNNIIRIILKKLK